MTDQDRIAISLFTLRLGVFLVMYMWTLDKFINPDHAAAVYENFYFIGSSFAKQFMYVLAAVEMLVILAFLSGFKKRITYGMVLLFHAVSTLSSWKQYTAPFDGSNLLFFAAWPMLAACFTLYLLRDMDTKFNLCGLCGKCCKWCKCCCPKDKEKKV